MRNSHLRLVPQVFNPQNEFGEAALPYAPSIELGNGEMAVPQQYLEVSRSLDNICNVLAKIRTPENFLLFAGQEGTCKYILVGIIGHENYARGKNSRQQQKIVYGRRWIIEDSTPTSEIVQTAMLAVKKAREHEVRELLSVRVYKQGKPCVTTPFNAHLDLPLMASNRSVLECSKSDTDADKNASSNCVEALMKNIKIAGLTLDLIDSMEFGSKCLFNLRLSAGQERCHFEELNNAVLTVVCEHQDGRDFAHQLMATIIKNSDRYVEEKFEFKGFKRFSHNVDVNELAKFSHQTRNIEIKDSRFDAEFEDMSYRVDAVKAPKFNAGMLGLMQRKTLSRYGSLDGYLPL